MTKIKRILVDNLKAIIHQEIDLNGCTVIVTGGNDKGKTTLLRGIIDRVRGVKLDATVHAGASEGSGVLELTSGEKFEWEFNAAGKDKLTLYTKDNYKAKVTKEIAAQFLPPSFDIDKFLNSPPKEQSTQLQKRLGVDFTEINNRYAKAYDERTEKNKEAERYQVKLAKMLEVPFVAFVDLVALQEKKDNVRAQLNEKHLANKAANDEKKRAWLEECNSVRKSVATHNDLSAAARQKYNSCYDAAGVLKANGFETEPLNTLLAEIRKNIGAMQEANSMLPAEPTYIQEPPDDAALKDVDALILTASETNTKAQAYKDYITYKASVEEATEEARLADEVVKGIEAEREQLVQKIVMPEGISFRSDGEILCDGFVLSNQQLSTSKKYTAALRIGAMGLGEVHAQHFDASFLDKNTLLDIQKWAAAQQPPLQLLIERPDFDGGEIKYQILESNGKA